MEVRTTFWHPYNLVVYLTALATVTIGAWSGTIILLLVQVITFFAWDVTFVISRSPMDTETAAIAMTRRTAIGTLLYYWLPVYGILIALLFVVEPDRQIAFLCLCSRAGVPMWLLMAPFVLSSISLLFVPVAVVHPETKLVSPAFKWMVFLVGFSQQCALVVFAHSVLRIVYILADEQVS